MADSEHRYYEYDCKEHDIDCDLADKNGECQAEMRFAQCPFENGMGNEDYPDQTGE